MAAAAKISGIYEIRNLVNGKRYVGSAVNIAGRWRQHRHHLETRKHHSAALQRAWNKYGSAAFQFDVLLTCPIEDLVRQENAAFGTLSPEYNIAKIAGNSAGIKRSSETCAKLSKALKGMKRSAESRAKQSATAKGRTRPPRSDIWCARLAASHVGRVVTPEWCRNISRALTGRTRSAEHCRNISIAQIARYQRNKLTRIKETSA